MASFSFANKPTVHHWLTAREIAARRGPRAPGARQRPACDGRFAVVQTRGRWRRKAGDVTGGRPRRRRSAKPGPQRDGSAGARPSIAASATATHIRDGYFDMGGGKKFHMSDRGMKPPVTMGHEPRHGDRRRTRCRRGAGQAGSPRIWTGCGKCARCLEGRDNPKPDAAIPRHPASGGYADHMLVPHPRYLVDASGVDPMFASVLACSGLTTYKARSTSSCRWDAKTGSR